MITAVDSNLASQMVAPQQVRAVLSTLLLAVVPLIFFLPIWALALMVVLVLGRAGWHFGHLPTRKVLWPILGLMMLLFWIILHTLDGQKGSITCLLLLVGIKIYESRTLRDWRVVLALGFFLTAMPLLFNQSPITAAWMVVSLWALTSMMGLLSNCGVRESMRSALTALGLSVPLMAALFLVVPRLQTPLWGIPLDDGSASIGLGDSMEPGSISQLITRQDPVFSAVFEGNMPAQKELYWRMVILDMFDGKRWSVYLPGAEYTAQTAGGKPLYYTVTMRPNRSRLPVLDIPVQQEEPGRLVPGLLSRIPDGQQQYETIHYRAQSQLGGQYISRLLPEQKNFYLHIPAGNPQTRALSQQWRATSKDGMDWARHMLDWLRNNRFRYTLTPPLLHGNGIDEFLFSTRRGFCEHYASAMAFAARAAGIPSRVVLGYQGGLYNQVGQFWQVRSSDAHAWVEIWLDKTNEWFRVDPTAAVAPDRVLKGIDSAVPGLIWKRSWLERAVGDRWAAINFTWQQWVVGYDANRQKDIFDLLGLGTDVDSASVLKGMMLGLLLASIPFILWHRRRVPLEPTVLGWGQLKQALRRRKILILNSDGPLECLHKARTLPAKDYQSLQSLVDRYIELRYAHKVQDKHQISKWLRAVKRF